MPDEVIVTWSTPMLQAERTLHAAGEALEFHRVEEAARLLHEHMGHIRALVQFIQQHPSLTYEEKK